MPNFCAQIGFEMVIGQSSHSDRQELSSSVITILKVY